MDDSKMEPSSPISDKDVKAPNVVERTKAEIEATHHSTKSHDHHKESHGMCVDIDENTSINNVKAPNVFERVQEEIEALVQTIHTKKDTNTHDSSSKGTEHRDGTTKEEIKGNTSEDKNKSHDHHKESHGMRVDIDENTSINNVKAPNVFERVQEEIEALVQTIHTKKDAHTHDSSSKGTEYRDGTVKVESNGNASEEKKADKPNLIKRAKEKLQSVIHKGKSPNHHHHHHKETHGTSDDINDDTPINEVKGPNVFERAKEEVEAIVQTIHQKKQSKKGVHSPQKES